MYHTQILIWGCVLTALFLFPVLWIIGVRCIEYRRVSKYFDPILQATVRQKTWQRTLKFIGRRLTAPLEFVAQELQFNGHVAGKRLVVALVLKKEFGWSIDKGIAFCKKNTFFLYRKHMWKDYFWPSF